MYESVCFVVSPIGDPGSAVRNRADAVFAAIIEPAVTRLGFTPLRADQIERPGLISIQMLNYLVRSPLVIADATGNNPNVLYEIGVRHAIGKPLIQIAEFGSKLPFDIESIRRIEFDRSDVGSYDHAIDLIAGQAELLLANESAVRFSLHAEVGLDYQTVDGLLIDAAVDLRDTFRSIDSTPRNRTGRLEDLRFLVDFVRRIDPDNGHGHYFAGELALLQEDRARMRREFFKYLDRVASEGATLVLPDTGQDICYRFPHGFCRQRTGWICHLLATTFVDDLEAAASDEQVVLYARRVLDYGTRALESYPPGFSQIEPTVSMVRRARAVLGDVAGSDSPPGPV